MTKLKHAILATVAAVALSSTAYANEGTYVSIGAGFHIPQSSRVTVAIPSIPSTTTQTVKFDNGVILNGAIGYKWGESFRTEFEVGWRNAKVDTLNTFAATGSQRVLGLMGNLLFDIGVGTNFQPYLGGGVGLGWNKWKRVEAATAVSPVFAETDSAVQWQGIVGASMPFGERVDGYLEYRYIGLINNRFAGTAPTATLSNHDDGSHNIMVGLRFFFGPKMEKAVAAPPPPPPPPAAPPPPPPRAAAPPPPPVPQKFIVFFDWDRSNLRDDAQRIVQEASDYAKKNGKAVIHTTGHADTSGTASYNIGLSERRAQAVKAALLKMGFGANDVSVAFKGESEPLVATGDGVREPQNRRVEIVMD